MKLILHMWVALFYSKPFRSPTVRKVVEHSNPAKYVSLNSVVDPLELIDDGEGFCASDKHSADLFTEGYQSPDKVDGRARSPVEKPLSCNELSSTNCIENEAPLADSVETSGLPLKGGPVSYFASDLENLPQVPGKEAEELFFLDPVFSRLSDGSLNGQGRGCSRLDVEAEVETASVVEVSQSNLTSVLPEQPETAKDTQGVTSTGSAISVEKLEINNDSSFAKEDSCQISSIEPPHSSRATWLEATAECGKDGRLYRGKGDSRDLLVDEDEEDVDGENMELESIDLALSDSNDADAEPRDVDSDQDSEELSPEDCVAEETCVCDAASSGDSLTTLTPSPTASFARQSASETVTESPEDQEDPAGLAPKPAFLNQTDFVEGFCVLQDSKRDGLADFCPSQTVPFHQVILDEATESAVTEDAVESPQLPVSPDQTDLVEHSGISQEDKEICLANSVSLQATELNRIRNDSVTRGDFVGSPFGKSQRFSDPFDPDSVSEGGKETSWANSALQGTNPAHRPRPDGKSELLGNQEDSAVSTKCPESPDQMNVIEAESREESAGNQSDFLASAKNLTSSKQSGLVGDSCVSRAEKETLNSLSSAPLQNHLAHRTTPDEATTLAENQEDATATAPSPAFPEPVSSDEGSCTDWEEEDMNVSDTDRGGQKTGQMLELRNDAVEVEEIQGLGLDGSEFGANWKGPEPSDKNENSGNVSAVEEKACDDKLSQAASAVPEEIKSFLCELIDTVSGVKAESDGASSKEDSGLNWISSMTLECVTPPESDDESHTTDQFTPSGPKLVVDEHLEKQSIFLNQEDGQCRSTSYKGLRSHRVAGVEREPFRENEAALIATDVLTGCTDGTKLATRSLDGKSQLAETAVSSRISDSPVLGMPRELWFRPASREVSNLARENSSFREGNVEILACVPGGCSVEYPPEESDSPLQGDTSKGQKQGDPKDALDVQLASEQMELPIGVLDPKMNEEVESLSGDDDQEHFGDPYRRNPSVSTCYTRSIDSRGVTGATCVRDLSPEEEISTSDDWVYSGKKTRILDVEPEAKCFDWPFTSRREERPVPPSLKADGEQGPLKDYINFSVTKKHKDKTRTFHPSKRGDSFVKRSGLINSLSRSWRVLDDPIQSTLDMECLRFHYKLKHILEKKRPQLSTSSDLFAKEFATQAVAEMLPLRKVPKGPVLNLPPRSRSPLLITIVNPSARRNAVHWYPKISTPDDSFDPLPLLRDSFSKVARFKSKGQERLAPFHLNKLTYNNKLKDCRGDISVIMDEFAELSRVMKLDDRQTSKKGQNPNTTSEDVPEKRCQSLPGRMTSYEHLFDDLCNTLHFRLTNVVKEACKKPYSFYLVETDDDPFFGRIKNLLKKGGHSEADPQLFCKAGHPETDRLMVIIRNEDIFLHIHKIPSLLRLKRSPSVTFAGVDSPEDILDQTDQELFGSGGFVVSDDQVLETMTTGELKDVVKTLEQLNGHRKWRWLLHHKETKKLRESARVDPVARSKDLILQSCQGANFTEVLHYHRCDSRSAPRSEYLNCLLNLQVQHISARLAVFLTENPAASREAFESKGILVLDVSTFVATAQDLATSCRSNY